jgi:hypothetical protein
MSYVYLGLNGSGVWNPARCILISTSPGSKDEIYDLLAELEKVEKKVSQLSETSVQSIRGLEANQKQVEHHLVVLSYLWLTSASFFLSGILPLVVMLSRGSSFLVVRLIVGFYGVYFMSLVQLIGILHYICKKL